MKKKYEGNYELCGKHLMDGRLTKELIEKVENNKEKIPIKIKEEGNSKLVCLGSSKEADIKKFKDEYDKYF